MSVVLNTAEEQFEIVEKGGQYILKPPNPNFDELPQNEDLTMRLANIANITVPLHGMIYNIDNTLTYFINSFRDFFSPKSLFIYGYAVAQKISLEEYKMRRGGGVV